MTKDAENDRNVTADGKQTSVTDGHGRQDDVQPVLQVVCLGSGGGPSEDNVTGFLVRSLESGWSKGSLLAVDAGSHLAAITRILEKSFPLYSTSDGPVAGGSKASTTSAAAERRKNASVLTDGPFAGVRFHNESARANALHLLHTYISCYLITHPHLDHLAGFAVNTAALHGRSRPKTLAALPGTVDAIKRHIFNDVIWPNLSDEDGGVGFVSYQRLKEGGDIMVGAGDARGYINVCDGLAVRAFSVSHGICTRGASTIRRGSNHSGVDLAAAFNGHCNTELMPDYTSMPGTPGAHRASMYNVLGQAQYMQSLGPCVVDSTAYFLRDEETEREILIFGDVEPDSVSIAPRNRQVWAEAALRIPSGILRGILIECSYSDAVTDETLFGHLCPRHLIAELETLAEMVHSAKIDGEPDSKKRKRSSQHGIGSLRFLEGSSKRSNSQSLRSAPTSRTSGLMDPDGKYHDNVYSSQDGDALSPRALAARKVSAVPYQALPAQAHSTRQSSLLTWDDPPLAGLSVVIIHVKDTFQDGPCIGETILSQLLEHEEALRKNGRALGCKFTISKCGESYWF